MSKDIQAVLFGMTEGDMDALGKLYGILSVRIFNYARSITNNKEMAEDITHDAFLQTLKQAERLTKMSAPVAYIMVTTRNLSFDYLKRNRRTTASLDEASEINVDFQPHDKVIFDEAFSSLPANQRETVYLHHVCGFTQKETAEIMGVPLVTVKWRCGKALSTLRAYFTQNEEDDYNEVT